MRQIIKFCDLTREQTVALDEVLKSDAVRSQANYDIPDPAPQPGGGFARYIYDRITFAHKLRIKKDKNGRFTYELEIQSAVSTYERWPRLIRCPKQVIEAINGILGFVSETTLGE